MYDRSWIFIVDLCMIYRRSPKPKGPKPKDPKPKGPKPEAQGPEAQGKTPQKTQKAKRKIQKKTSNLKNYNQNPTNLDESWSVRILIVISISHKALKLQIRNLRNTHFSNSPPPRSPPETGKVMILKGIRVWGCVS